MKQWIVCVVDCLRSCGDGGNQNIDKIVCSHEYLSCALKIAHSLADQLSAVEEERGYKEKSRRSSIDNSPPLIVRGEKSWSEYVSVYCTKIKAMEEKKDDISVNKKDDEGDEGHASIDADFEPLPYNCDDLEPADFQHLARQLSSLLSDNDREKGVDYLDVRGAILNEEAVEERPLSDNGKLEIRSLGFAFYELFSGGQITAEAVLQQRFSAPLSRCPTRSPFSPFGQASASSSIDTTGGRGR